MIPRRRVLVLDDDLQFQRTIVPHLGSEFAVLSSSSGQCGISQVLANHPEVVLFGLHMPSCDAILTLRAFHENPKLRGIPILMLSPQWTKDPAAEAARYQVDDYLVKDIHLWKILIPHLHALLDKAQRQPSPSPTPNPAAIGEPTISANVLE